MMQIGRYLILVNCCLSLTACATTTAALGQRVPFEPAPDLPNHWNAGVSDRMDEYGCPLLAGRYEVPPEIVEIAGGELELTTGNEFEYFNLFLGPLHAEKVGSIDSANEPFLALSRTAPDSLTLRALAPDKVNDVAYRLPIGPNGLQCVGGYFQLPTYETSMTVEGTWLNSQQFRRFGTLSDGSLVYYEQYGPLKKIIKRSGRFTHRFYRFRAVKEAGN